jgi:hypothetical protein
MRTKNKEELPPPGAENIVPLPVEQMKVYPLATGMTEEDIEARIQKVYWSRESDFSGPALSNQF